MTLHALGSTLFLMAGAHLCVYAVSRGVDAWLKLPMKGMTMEKFEERYGPQLVLRPSELWKRGLLVFTGTLFANTLLTVGLYAAGWLTEATRPTLKSFWFFTVFFSLPFSEITFWMDRRKPLSPLFIGWVVAGWFGVKHWMNIVAKPFLGICALMVMFTLGWNLQRFDLRKRGRL